MEPIEKIRELMDQREWSEYRLSKESGLPQSTISNIFHRNTLPSIPTLEVICNAFGLTISQFFAERPSVELNSEQYELIQRWARLTDSQKAILQNLMDEFLMPKG